MKRRLQIFMLSGLLLLAAMGCSRKEKVSSDTDSSDNRMLVPDSEIRDAKIQLYEKDLVTTEILAERLLKFEARDSTMVYVLNINFFDSIGNIKTHLVGDSGIIRERSNLLYVYGNVVVTTADSSKLETDYLFWNTNTDKIQTDAFVRITKQNDVITGWGMETDPGLTRIKILNQVSGTIHDNEDISE